ncbi:MAG TPA: TolC family protein [Flavobacteriaceae bacterium]|nr:TolC family protein [Flavobacteriaceae bacterium]
MALHKKLLLIVVICFWGAALSAQEIDTLKLDLPEVEKLLLENNLSLLAEELNIDIADAEIIQAKIWPNPTLSVDELNPYVSNYQKRHAEEQASLFGSESFGKYRQIEAQLEQVFSLAGSRKKRKAMAEVAADQAEAYLADFLLDLKTAFRKTIFDFTYHRLYHQMLNRQLTSLQTILTSYEKQYQQGNINKMELTRLRVSEMKLKDEIIDQQNTLGALQAELIVLLNLPDKTNLIIEDVFKPNYDYQTFSMDLDFLQDQALTNRPDIRISVLEQELAEKEYAYEKSEGVPELGVSISYDRGGGIYPDYVGLGFSIDLPFSNPNKGNIKKAKINIQQQEYFHQQHLLKVKTDIRNKYDRAYYFSQFFDGIDADYVEDLDKTMEAYTEYFKNRTINITTYMDFLEAYNDSKESIFDNEREFFKAVEDLKYATGIELNI